MRSIRTLADSMSPLVRYGGGIKVVKRNFGNICRRFRAWQIPDANDGQPPFYWSATPCEGHWGDLALAPNYKAFEFVRSEAAENYIC